MISDSNVMAQEKGVEAASVWIDRSQVAIKNAAPVINSLVEKCLGARPKSVEAAQLSLFYYIEREAHDLVLVSYISIFYQ